MSGSFIGGIWDHMEWKVPSIRFREYSVGKRGKSSGPSRKRGKGEDRNKGWTDGSVAYYDN